MFSSAVIGSTIYPKTLLQNNQNNNNNDGGGDDGSGDVVVAVVDRECECGAFVF